MQKKESFFKCTVLWTLTDGNGLLRGGGVFVRTSPYKSVFVRICPFISKMPLGEGVTTMDLFKFLFGCIARSNQSDSEYGAQAECFIL